MKKIFLLLLTGSDCMSFAFCTSHPIHCLYTKTSYMIPMRDGILLNTVVLTPVNQTITLSLSYLTGHPMASMEIFQMAPRLFHCQTDFIYYTMASGWIYFCFPGYTREI